VDRRAAGGQGSNLGALSGLIRVDRTPPLTGSVDRCFDAHIPAEVANCCVKAASEHEMADRIYKLLANSDVRRTMIAQGLESSQQFGWETTVHQAIEVYEEVLTSR
jgi:glycosyltransferase involved in cell wall biosynthesis